MAGCCGEYACCVRPSLSEPAVLAMEKEDKAVPALN
jgi:hypothetical protein